jgi:hypothetical protein
MPLPKPQKRQNSISPFYSTNNNNNNRNFPHPLIPSSLIPSSSPFLGVVVVSYRVKKQRKRTQKTRKKKERSDGPKPRAKKRRR